jgi:dephospho-CoA kinase
VTAGADSAAGTEAVVVALIGPLGSGKSRVRQALAERGAAVLDFDDYSRQLLRPGTAEYEAVRREFGEGYFRKDGSLDRGALAGRIFADAEARERLNRIVHPGMLARLREAIVQFRASPSAPMLVVEGALLGQLPTAGLFDLVLMVQAPRGARIRRIRERDGLSEEEARRRIDLHEHLGIGRERADFTVVNDGDERDLQAQVEAFWNWVRRGRPSS